MIISIATWLMAGGVPAQSVDAKVETTLQKLTIEEKIDLIAGIKGFYVRAVPKGNIPELKMSDGPVGVRNDGPTTAYPAGVALAATWNPALSRRFGEAIGRDARARGVHFWLGPGVNLARVPQNGRNFEYGGEDPLLCGRTAVGIIKGVQSQGVVATVKHYAGNENETDRMNDSSEIDERTARELYLRPFEMAVKEGKVEAIMPAYNRWQGIYCAENNWLHTLLRKEWGFKGVSMSDWGAVHSVKGTALYGVDLEMPGPDFMNAKNLLPLINDGTIPVSAIDAKVRSILRTAYTMKFDQRDQLLTGVPRNDPTNEVIAREIAREGVVLLKNQGQLLPLNRKKHPKIIVLGPNAEPAVTGGGGSSYTQPVGTPVSIVNALKAVAGNGVTIDYRPGFGTLGNQAFNFTEYGTEGLKQELFSNSKLEGDPVETTTIKRLNLRWQGKENFSVRWTGSIIPKKSGDYLVVGGSDDGMRAFIDGKSVFDMWGEHGYETSSNHIHLEAGRRYDLKVEYWQGYGEAVARFGLERLDSDPLGPIAKDLKSADAVIVATGFHPGIEAEGGDRSFVLPNGQDKLIQELTKFSSKVIVVNHSGAGVDMSNWVDKTPVVVQNWYPGGTGNLALAEILFGDANPSGKLPTTFPRTLKGTYYEKAYPAVKGHIVYREGLHMGYRWFDANHVKPLFPFGYGLSYTSFSVSRLKVKDKIVSVTVKNTGKRAGDEVVQAYVQAPGREVPRPLRELKGYVRVSLKPGESKQVTLELGPLSYWNVKGHRWQVEKGVHTVWVGTSSQDLPLKASFVPKVK